MMPMGMWYAFSILKVWNRLLLKNQCYQVYFSGVQWSGFESDGCAHGLWTRNYKDMLKQIKSVGFNMLRLSFAGETLKSSTRPKNINYWVNKDLKVWMFDYAKLWFLWSSNAIVGSQFSSSYGQNYQILWNIGNEGDTWLPPNETHCQ